MRVALDTNVLISAALKRDSVPAAAVLTVEAGHVLLKSTETERQVFNVIARPYFVPLIGAEIRAWLTRLMSIAERVDIVDRINA